MDRLKPKGKVLTMNRKTHPYFIESDAAGSRKETATLLVGTASEHGIDQRDIRTTRTGFRISAALAEVLGVAEEGDEPTEPVTPTAPLIDVPEQTQAREQDEDFDPADHKVDEVKEFVTENPDEAEAVLDLERDGEDRKTLVKWITEFIDNRNTDNEE